MDVQTISRCKKAIREIWQWSSTYRGLIESTKRGRGDYVCQNCNQGNNNKADMYVEHLIALEFHDYETLEEYYYLMRDLTNLEVWSKKCCKSQKDKSDRKLIREKKKVKGRASQSIASSFLL